MQAVGYRQPGAIDAPDALIDVTLPEPAPSGRDLLVRVEAVSVNPVDAKLRRSSPPDEGADIKVLGFDAVGVVVDTGPDAELFQVGDAVWYAGVVNRPGSNAELQVVDERIVGRRPISLDAAQAAAMPLTTLTAWELLFERLGVPASKTSSGDAILIVGAAGGVGSILIQIATQLTGLTVIGSVSRAETEAWVRGLGADYVIDHGKPLSAELERIGIGQVTYAAGLTHTGEHFDEIVACLAPQGALGLIDDPASLDANKLKRKCLSLRWEFMFARPLYQTADMAEQHRILEETARLVEAGVLRSHYGEHYGRINADNLKRAHAALEGHGTKGKIVLEGFDG